MTDRPRMIYREEVEGKACDEAWEASLADPSMPRLHTSEYYFKRGYWAGRASWLAERDALVVEGGRLRAALREVSVYGGGDGGDWVECCNIASAALDDIA